MSSPILSVTNLTKIFYAGGLFRARQAPYTAVNNTSFELKEGEILGILGPNGAGKTTLIEMLLGTLKPTSGQITYFGKDFFKHSAEIRQQLTHASAYHKLPSALTVEENLDIVGRLYGISERERKRRIERLLKQFGIEGLRHKQAGTLSAGQITRVMLVKAFLPQPKILLLDEPTASLDPDIAMESRRFILEQQKAAGVSIILTSHNMQEVAEVCNRALVLQKGAIIEEDTPAKLARSVALTEVSFVIAENLEAAVRCLEGHQWHYQVIDGELRVEIDEGEIARLLQEFARLQIVYTHIEIEKPTLEDYFLQISRRGKQKS